MQNNEVAKVLEKVASLLDLQGENPFRVRAYRNAAFFITSFGRPVEEMVNNNEDLTELPGVGKDLAGKIKEIIETGTLPLLQTLEKKTPPELIELTNIPGLGPKKVRKIYETLKVRSVQELQKAAMENKIASIPGFGRKTQKNILEGIRLLKTEAVGHRHLWTEAKFYIAPFLEFVKKAPDIEKIEVAGSFRRKKETVGDIDIVISSTTAPNVIEHILRYQGISDVLAQGDTKCSLILNTEIQVDIRVVSPSSFGAALYYFTGSKEHNIELRRRALEIGLKINEYAVMREGKKVAGSTEEEVLNALGFPFIQPELRENLGEFEAALKGKLPKLIEISDIKGDLHAHTKATDGKNTLEEMAQKAKKLGLEYLAITEHSQKVKIAKGLTVEQLERHIEKIDQLNDQLKGLRILKSIEVDILEDGKLDLPNDILKKLDLRVCSVHFGQRMPLEQMTNRILRAMDNPYFNILGHPTGRLLGKRAPYEVDFEKICQKAYESGIFLEINSQPSRRDLSGELIKMAKEMGVKFALSTDAHSIHELEQIFLGVFQARRGWLESSDVINTLSWTNLKKILKR